MDNEYLVIDPNNNYYSRNDHTENRILRETLSKLYKSEYVLLTTSGMHAISTILFSFNKNNFNLIYGNELFSATPKLFNDFQTTHENVKLYQIDVRNNEEILKLFDETIKNQDNFLFIESCSNPNGYIFDFEMIEDLRKLSKSLYVVCDNTWLSNQIFNPMKYCDVTVLSLTKYYSAGHAIAGACIFKNKEDYDRTYEINKMFGIHVSPHNLQIINENMKNQNERITNSSKLTLQIIEKYEKIIEITHPYLENHDSHFLAEKYFKNGLYPSVFTFKLNMKMNAARKIFEKMKILEYKTSFGSKMSRIDTFPVNKKDYVQVRLSIGYDDNFERICQGIDEILNKK